MEQLFLNRFVFYIFHHYFLKNLLKKFFFFASFKTRKIFLEFPLVDITINESPLFPIPSRVLEKICSKPISLPQAVSVEVSKAKGITG